MNAIANDIDFKHDKSYTITLPKDGERANMADFYGMMCSSYGSVQCWIAVNNCDEYEERRFYGLTPPTFWQRFYAKLRRWYVMQAWKQCDLVGWKVSPGQVFKGVKLKRGDSYEEVEGVLYNRGDTFHVDADVWLVGWGSTVPMQAVCRDYDLVEEKEKK